MKPCNHLLLSLLLLAALCYLLTRKQRKIVMRPLTHCKAYFDAERGVAPNLSPTDGWDIVKMWLGWNWRNG